MVKVTLKSMTLTDFKGMSNRIYNFGKKNVVKGKNGRGKTTIADAFYWLFADKNYNLFSNPNIRPNDGRECIPTVRLVLDVDGKEVEVAKMQKAKYSKPDADGNRKVTLTNTYEINSVEKTERDFKSYLSDLGFDLTRFLQLSHPAMFILGMNDKKLRDQMRETLFAMVENFMSDLEVARLSPKTATLASMLEKWTLKEVEAMQTATLRKIRENYGKDGEILRAKIAGLESAKTRIDVSEMELGKNAVLERLEEIAKQTSSVQDLYDEQMKLSDGVLRLKFKLSDMQTEANKELDESRSSLIRTKYGLESELRSKESEIAYVVNEITRLTKENDSFETKKKNKADEWKKVKALKFDEATTVCQYCGQNYPEERTNEIRSSFEENKKKALAGITEEGMKYKNAIEENKKEISALQDKLKDFHNGKDALEVRIADLAAEIESMPSSVDISETDDYKEIVRQIEEKEVHLNQCKTFSESIKEFDKEKKELEKELRHYEAEIAKASNDDAIDEQIAQLKEKQMEYEQSIADCESILDQIKIIYRTKNELLTDEVNSHFEIVKWMFFDYQKNGEYKEVCIPTIDGKRFGTHTNTGLEVLAKLDIVKGLQKYFGQYYPVFLDGAECLDNDSAAAIEMESQLIMLKVSNDKELIWEVA